MCVNSHMPIIKYCDLDAKLLFSVSMTPKDISKIIRHWQEASKHDMDVALSLFKTGKYDYCLFLCHLMLEKILKAIVASVTKEHPPFTHNLLYLAGKANLELTKVQIEELDKINKFNMEVRYPEDLKAMLGKVTREYAKKYFDISKELWKWFQNRLDQC
ncbi:MAG: HEPN domain-containing protein [Pseudomonadota bacterium]